MEVCVFYPWQSKQPNKFKLLKNFTVNKKCPYDSAEMFGHISQICVLDRSSVHTYIIDRSRGRRVSAHLKWTSPAIVLRNMRYSKLEISLRCQRCVMLDDLNSWRGVAKEIRLKCTHTRNVILYFKSWHCPSKTELCIPGLWQTVTRSYTDPRETVDHPFNGGLVGEVKHHRC